MPAEIGPRGCGDKRVPGGVYLESAFGPNGLPFETFLIDPPLVLTRDQLASIPRLGIQLAPDRGGVMNVLDWIGEANYPYAPDFIEEGRRRGFSRKINPNVDLSALSRGSRMFFMHAKGALSNWREYHAAQRDADLDELCALHAITKSRKHYGPSVDEHCIRHLWAALAPSSGSLNAPGGEHTKLWRRFVDFEYRVFPTDPVLSAPFVPAVIAAFPITNITVIAKDGDAHRDTLQDIQRRSPVPVFEAVA